MDGISCCRLAVEFLISGYQGGIFATTAANVNGSFLPFHPETTFFDLDQP
jgi:hypothetical protein